MLAQRRYTWVLLRVTQVVALCQSVEGLLLDDCTYRRSKTISTTTYVSSPGFGRAAYSPPKLLGNLQVYKVPSPRCTCSAVELKSRAPLEVPILIHEPESSVR